MSYLFPAESNSSYLPNPTETATPSRTAAAPTPSRYTPATVIMPTKSTPVVLPRQNKPTTSQQNYAGTRLPTPRGRSRSRRSSRGAPTKVSVAPVSIGNTVKGVKTTLKTTRSNSCVVTGRDFCFQPLSTGAVTTWTLCGGTPLTPAAFVDSTLRQMTQRYNKFRFLKLVAHYITSSPTTANGDVMFYYAKNRESPFLNQTSNNLLPFVISDPHTVLGPQWQNHSATFEPSVGWKSTDYGIDADVSEYADGDLFLMSRTSTADSPGFVIFDYEIEFAEESIIPRLLTLPIARIQWSQVALQNALGVVTAGTGFTLAPGGVEISGLPSSMPAGATNGDIYKMHYDVTNSTLNTGSTTVTTFLVPEQTGGAVTVNAVDGTTVYGVWNGTNFAFYPSAAAAYAGNRQHQFSGSLTVATVSTFQFWLSYIGNFGLNMSSNF